MIDYLKEHYSLPWLSRREARKSAGHRSSIHYWEAKNVLVLFTMQGNTRVNRMREFQKLFEADSKKIKFIYVLLHPEDLPDAHMDEGMVRVGKKDISLTGNVEDNKVKNLLRDEFDLLIHADLESNVYIDYLLSKIRAKNKVGRHIEGRERFYDLMIEIGSERKLDFLLEQIYKYTKVI
jgi:uncharacterized protein YrzB (UPF0473 family)